MSNRENYLIFANRKRLYEEEVLTKNPQPVPGSFYTVPKGAWIDTISRMAYGYDRSYDIVEANSDILANRVIIQGLPNIQPGDVLWLPASDVENSLSDKIPANDPYEIGIRINGKIFKGWVMNSIERAMNSIADSFSFTAPYDPEGDPDSIYLDPFTYLPTDLFIGGELYISGRSELWHPKLAGDSANTEIQCRSITGVLIDCTPTDKNLVYINMTLKQIAEKLLRPFGLFSEFPEGDSQSLTTIAKGKRSTSVKSLTITEKVAGQTASLIKKAEPILNKFYIPVNLPASGNQQTGNFTQVKREITQKIFEFLQKLAKASNFIPNSTVKGKLSFQRANINGEPIFNLVQGQQPLLSIDPTYDGTKRFSEYTAVSQNKGVTGNMSTVLDKSIPVKRPIVFNADESHQGNIKQAAEWQKSRALAESARLTVVIEDWRDKKRRLIRENNIVTVYAPKVAIFKETRFLIEKVSFGTSGDGRQATLTLVLPESYTNTFPEVFPWQR